MEEQPATRWIDRVWLAQAIYYLASGAWPVINMRSFLALTDEKTARWLIKIVGVLLSVMGAALAFVGVRRRITPEVAAMGIGTSTGMAAVDIVVVACHRSSRVDLIDALAHLTFVAGWIIALRRGVTGQH